MKTVNYFKTFAIMMIALFSVSFLNAQCVASFTSAAGSNGAYTFTNTSTGAGNMTNYYWDFGDGNYSSATNPSHTYANGAYQVCLVMSDSLSGCTSTYCDSILVTNGQGGGGTGGGNNNPCVFNHGAYPDSTGNGAFFWTNSTGSTYFWDFGDGTTSTMANPHHVYTAPGTYYYCVTVDSCPPVCDSIVVGNNGGTGGGNNNPCQASFYAYPDSSAQYGVIVVNTSTGNGLTYYWDFGDGNSSTQAWPQHTYAQPGIYHRRCQQED